MNFVPIHGGAGPYGRMPHVDWGVPPDHLGLLGHCKGGSGDQKRTGNRENF